MGFMNSSFARILHPSEFICLYFRSSSGCNLRGAQRGLAAGYLALFSRPVPDLHLRQVVQLRAVRPAWPLKRAPRDGSEDLVKEWGELRLKLRSGSFVSVRVIDWMS